MLRKERLILKYIVSKVLRVLEFDITAENKVVIFLFYSKPTHALFLKHIHIYIYNTKLLKMFVKHIIKNLHVSVTIV
jgi:hypothetical protein